MQSHEQIISRIRAHRKYQPSAIGNSLFMLLVRYTSLFGFLFLAGTSIYIYAASGNLQPKHGTIDRSVEVVKDIAHLRAEHSIDQAYLLMIISFMLLAVYKLTTMVLRRNDYIYTLNEVMDGEE